jgi:hypothetical protein
MFRSSYSRQKKFGKRVPKFKTRGKMEIRVGKKRLGGRGRKRNFPEEDLAYWAPFLLGWI